MKYRFKEKDKLRDKIIKLRKEIKVLEKQWKNLCDEDDNLIFKEGGR